MGGGLGVPFPGVSSSISISFSMDVRSLGRSRMCGLEPGKQVYPAPGQQPQTEDSPHTLNVGYSQSTSRKMLDDSWSRCVGRPGPGLDRWGGG